MLNKSIESQSFVRFFRIIVLNKVSRYSCTPEYLMNICNLNPSIRLSKTVCLYLGNLNCILVMCLNSTGSLHLILHVLNSSDIFFARTCLLVEILCTTTIYIREENYSGCSDINLLESLFSALLEQMLEKLPMGGAISDLNGQYYLQLLMLIGRL